MFAHRRHTAADRLDTPEQAAGVKMFRAKRASAAVNAFKPRHQLQVFPYRAQQNLIEMGMRVDEPRHEDRTAGVDDLVVCRDWRDALTHFRNDTVASLHVTGERPALFGHRQNQRVGDREFRHFWESPLYFPESLSMKPL